MYLRLKLAGMLPCLVAAALASGCGSDDSATEERIRAERADARADAKKEERLREIERELRERDKRDRERGDGGGGGGAPSAPSPAPAMRSCGDGVTANGKTSCPFALNVRNEYYSSGQSSVIQVHSPATGRVYTMSCTSGSPHTCTGGDDAAVTFQ